MSANVGFDQANVLVRDRAVSTRIVLVTDCDPAPAAVKGLRKRLREEWRSAAAAVDVVPVPRSSGPSAAFWLSRLAHAAVCPRDWHPDLYAVQPFLGWTFESVVRETNAEVILISVISPPGNGGPLDGGQELVYASPGNFFNARVGSKDLTRIPLRCRPHASDVRIALFPHGDCDDDPWVDLWLHPKHVFPDVCANVKPGDPVTITPAA